MFGITDSAGGYKEAPINSAGEVAVTSAQFYLSPTFDQSELNAENIVQPRVTLALSIKNVSGQEKFAKSLDLQTTISSKLYK
jgi:hypothetical protein